MLSTFLTLTTRLLFDMQALFHPSALHPLCALAGLLPGPLVTFCWLITYVWSLPPFRSICPNTAVPSGSRNLVLSHYSSTEFTRFPINGWRAATHPNMLERSNSAVFGLLDACGSLCIRSSILGSFDPNISFVMCISIPDSGVLSYLTSHLMEELWPFYNRASPSINPNNIILDTVRWGQRRLGWTYIRHCPNIGLMIPHGRYNCLHLILGYGLFLIWMCWNKNCCSDLVYPQNYPCGLHLNVFCWLYVLPSNL